MLSAQALAHLPQQRFVSPLRAVCDAISASVVMRVMLVLRLCLMISCYAMHAMLHINSVAMRPFVDVFRDERTAPEKQT